MKLLKSISNTLIVALSVATVCSCTDKESDEILNAESLSEEQIEKIAYGCDTYATEATTDEKVETDASEE